MLVYSGFAEMPARRTRWEDLGALEYNGSRLQTRIARHPDDLKADDLKTVKAKTTYRQERLTAVLTEYLAHHADQLERSRITDPIINAVGIFARGQDAFVAQNGEVLRNVTLRCANMLDDVLHADLFTA